MTLLELAERCERATGPDRELDAAIATVFRVKQLTYEGDKWIRDPEFTASLDTAMTLAPRDYSVEIGSNCWARVRPQDTLDQLDPRVVLIRKASTPALALCAAALRLRAQAGEQHD